MNKYKKDYLEDFAYLYNNYKESGMIPKEIKEKLTTILDFKESKYYEVLKECRKNGLIVDSYEENREKMIERMFQNSITHKYENKISIEEKSHILKQASIVSSGSFEINTSNKKETMISRAILFIKRLFKRNKI